jgi:hypothetical protein
VLLVTQPYVTFYGLWFGDVEPSWVGVVVLPECDTV